MLVLSKETTLTSLADLQLGTSLTSDYTVLLNSTPVLQQVIKNLGIKDISDEDLRKKITVENPYGQPYSGNYSGGFRSCFG